MPRHLAKRTAQHNLIGVLDTAFICNANLATIIAFIRTCSLWKASPTIMHSFERSIGGSAAIHINQTHRVTWNIISFLATNFPHAGANVWNDDIAEYSASTWKFELILTGGCPQVVTNASPLVVLC